MCRARRRTITQWPCGRCSRRPRERPPKRPAPQVTTAARRGSRASPRASHRHADRHRAADHVALTPRAHHPSQATPTPATAPALRAPRRGPQRRRWGRLRALRWRRRAVHRGAPARPAASALRPIQGALRRAVARGSRRGEDIRREVGSRERPAGELDGAGVLAVGKALSRRPLDRDDVERLSLSAMRRADALALSKPGASAR